MLFYYLPSTAAFFVSLKHGLACSSANINHYPLMGPGHHGKSGRNVTLILKTPVVFMLHGKTFTSSLGEECAILQPHYMVVKNVKDPQIDTGNVHAVILLDFIRLI